MSAFVITDAPLGFPMRRRPPLYVRPDEDAPFYAALMDTAAGIAVRICRADRPSGKRLLDTDYVDAPMHVVADAVHDLLVKLNRGEDVK